MNLRRLLAACAALLVTTGIALGAGNMTFSTGATFIPGPRLFDGTDLNVIVTNVNALNLQAAGGAAGTYTGSFNGTVGATTPNTIVGTAVSGTTLDGILGSVTPAAATVTTLAASSAITPTGGIAQAAGLTASARNINTCGAPATLATSGTDTANAASSDTYVAELFVPTNVSTTGAALFNGGTQNGSATIYLADTAGTQIAHTASTATSGASQYQLIAWVGGPIAVKGPATYYMYFQNSATSNTWRAWAVGHCGTVLATGGTYGTFPTLTPPTTFTTLVGPIGGLY